MKYPLSIVLGVFILSSCSTGSSSSESADTTAVEGGEFIEYNNPPAEGFNQEGSDLLATLLADKTMQAMGGRKAWDNSRYLKWNFFGRRNHTWDKTTGDVRIEVPENELTILMNINSKEGKVMKGEKEVTDSLDHYLQRGYEMWVNDSYWLVMPYKLKDTGVTLKYLREDTTMTGDRADVISLSFEDVGVTPENVYEVWVDTDSKLVTQWAYYTDSTSLEPRFVTPWADYKKYADIMLSGNRGKNSLSNIEVLTEVPDGTFTEF
jgi:plasmid maintenance system killer protein